MKIEDWGLIEYEASTQKQLELVDEVASGAEERLVFCSHPPIVTLGRASRAEDLVGWSGRVIEASRGGRATYHGPSQVIIYPILDLRRRGRDVHAYLRRLELATITALAECGLKGCEARTTKMGEESLTGVWTGDKKIASIGIAVRKWTTYHGVAINIDYDKSAHKGIQPCGFSSGIMTSLEEELGHKVNATPIFKLVFEGEFND